MTNEWDMGGASCMAGMGGMGGMVAMGVVGLLLLVGAVVLTVVLVRAVTHRSGSQDAPDAGSGRQILQERYARGELDTEEYRERLRILAEDGR